MPHTTRSNIKVGATVLVIQKKDQRSGAMTEGVVQNILTSAPNHSRGIKVRLETGEVGRVQEIVEQ